MKIQRHFTFCFIFLLLASYVEGSILKDDQDSCTQSLMAHVGLSMSPALNDKMAQYVRGVLFEHSNGQGFYPLFKLNQNSPGLHFKSTHFSNVYELDQLPALFLTTTILKSLSHTIHIEVLKKVWKHTTIYDINGHSLKEESKPLISNMFREYKQGIKDHTFHNPYLLSLELRHLFALLKDPHYSSYLTLNSYGRNITGLISYKPGNAVFNKKNIEIEDFYIFFETSHRLYVFLTEPKRNLSMVVLAFQKTSDRSLTDYVYYNHFEALQMYLKTASRLYNKIDEKNIMDVVDNRFAFSFNDDWTSQMMYRLQEALITLDMKPNEVIADVLRLWNNSIFEDQMYDIKIQTLLKIAHFLGVDIFTLISNVDLKPFIKVNETPLSSQELYQLEKLISQKLKTTIVGNSRLNMVQMSDHLNISLRLLENIIYRYHLPLYSILRNMLKALNINVEVFFQNIHLSKVQEENEKPQQKLSKTTEEQTQKSNNAKQAIDVTGVQKQSNDIKHIQFISNRIKKATSVSLIKIPYLERNKLLAVSLFLLDKQNPSMKTLLKAKYLAGITLSELIGQDPLENIVDPKKARRDPLSNDYIEKAYKLFAYYLGKQIMQLNLSLKEVAKMTNVQYDTLRSFFQRGKKSRYLFFVQMAEGLNFSLIDLFKNLEKDILQIDLMDLKLDIPIDHNQAIAKQEALRLGDRIHQVIQLGYISKSEAKMMGLRKDTLKNGTFKILAVISLIRSLCISFKQLSEDQDISSAINLKCNKNKNKLKPSASQKFLHRLRQHLKQKMREAHNSQSDLDIEKSVDQQYSSIHATYYKLALTAIYLDTTTTALLDEMD